MIDTGFTGFLTVPSPLTLMANRLAFVPPRLQLMASPSASVAVKLWMLAPLALFSSTSMALAGALVMVGQTVGGSRRAARAAVRSGACAFGAGGPHPNLLAGV